MKALLNFILMVSLISCSMDIQPPEIVSYSPPHNATVPSSCPVSVCFSNSMNKDKTQKAFVLVYGEYGDSSVKGNFAWSNNDTVMTFTPELPLRNGYYRLIIEKTACDTHNNTLVTQHISNFTIGLDTIPPEIQSLQPVDCSENISLNTSITITFSEPMDTASVEKNIRFTPSFDYTCIWNTANTILTITPYKPLLFNTWYQINISQCEDLSHNTMIQPVTCRFRTGSEYIRPLITGLYTTSISQNMAQSENFTVYQGANINDEIIITFSEPIDTSSITSSFIISPQTSWDAYWDNSNQTCTICFPQPLEVNTRYEIRINTNLKDIAQNTLLNDLCVYIVTNGNLSRTVLISELECMLYEQKALTPLSVTDLGNEFNQNTTYEFTVKFSTPVLRNSVPDNIKIQCLYGEQPEISGNINQYRWIDDSQTLKLTISAIEGGNVYKLTFKGGTDGIKSAYGIPMQNDVWYIFYFHPVD
ncbi:MAG: Ig-like domain-containing protein [Spirochaetota bacterium]